MAANPPSAIRKQPTQIQSMKGLIQTFTVQQATTLRSAPETGSVVRALPEGLRVYPTGNRDGMWWEIMDDNDNIGWVQNDRLAPGT